MPFKELHERALEVAARYLRAEAELLDVLQRVEACRGYRQMGLTSLFAYATRELKLSEDVALNYINVARKAAEVPQLKQAIERRQISVSKARKITPVLTKENHGHWIGLAIELPQKQVEREVARVNPKAATPERVRYVTGSRLQLSFGVSQEIMNEFKRAQDLVSSSTGKPADFEQTLAAVLKEFLDRKDPVRKAQRILAAKKTAPAETPKESTRRATTKAQPNQSDPRKPLPASLGHVIALRDSGQCTHVDPNGLRCSRRRWLDLHHKIPVSRGGPDAAWNLRTLCRQHHAIEHMEREERGLIPEKAEKGMKAQKETELFAP